jgi:hypothetical protein
MRRRSNDIAIAGIPELLLVCQPFLLMQIARARTNGSGRSERAPSHSYSHRLRPQKMLRGGETKKRSTQLKRTNMYRVNKSTGSMMKIGDIG